MPPFVCHRGPAAWSPVPTDGSRRGNSTVPDRGGPREADVSRPNLPASSNADSEVRLPRSTAEVFLPGSLLAFPQSLQSPRSIPAAPTLRHSLGQPLTGVARNRPGCSSQRSSPFPQQKGSTDRLPKTQRALAASAPSLLASPVAVAPCGGFCLLIWLPDSSSSALRAPSGS